MEQQSDNIDQQIDKIEVQSETIDKQSETIDKQSETIGQDSVNKIQMWWRKLKNRPICQKINNKFKFIIDLLTQHPDIMTRCLYEITKISILYNPQKNENKFIYGKLIEKSIINAFTIIGFHVTDLDDSHTVGSEYKNDITLLNVDVSIKAKLKKGGDVILINKKSTSKHNINMQLLLCVIQERKLYFIPSNIVDNSVYVKEDAGCISYKSKLFTFIDKQHAEYIYTFPELSMEEKNKLSLLKPIDIMTKLYLDTIQESL
jgi:hypothetical protein